MNTFFVQLILGGYENYYVKVQAPDMATVVEYVQENFGTIYGTIYREGYFYEVVRKRLTTQILCKNNPVIIGL